LYGVSCSQMHEKITLSLGNMHLIVLQYMG
jgi:hypothetical protein